ncbi:MAG: hypothetical protein PGN23_12110 [Sphingomonas adhaesiva]|uniref:helix-turn-helix transcriptional regulator n=1 Tax=Sphingomonas adhaesiva TaxID=28212 RepID=UPI002FFC1FD5
MAEGFWRAAHGQRSWESAIGGVVRQTRARFGDLVVASASGDIDHFQACNVSHVGMPDLIEHGIYDPARNPRINATLNAAPGRVLSEQDFLHGRDPGHIDLYRRFLIPAGGSEVMLAKLPLQLDGRIAAFTVSRAEGVGAASAAEKALFQALLPAISGAVEVAVRFGQMETDALVAAIGRDGSATMALGVGRQPVALSDSAEALLARGRHLVLRHRRLHAASAHSDAVLSRAIDDVVADGSLSRGVRRVVLRSVVEGDPPLLAIVSPIPSRGTGSFAAASVLLSIAGREPTADHAVALMDGFDLTRAEAAVVMGLVAGLDLRAIARERGVSYQTVRAQLRGAMAKTLTSRQPELVALVSGLLR